MQLKIGEKTLRKGGEMLINLMFEHIQKINLGYLNAGEKDFKVGLSLTINPGNATGNHKLKGDISFVTEKITDTASDSCDELQTDLFEEKSRPCYLRPGVEVFEKVCDKCERRIDLIFVSGEGLPQIIDKNDDLPHLKEGQMFQHSSCPAWADEDYKEWCDMMVARETETQPKLKKIAGGKR
jgi:hypothetical protein